MRVAFVAVLLTLAVAPPPAVAAEGPVGWDVYRRLDLLPRIQQGERTLQSSSYDRTGGNNDGFNGTYSCLREVAEGCVIAEHTGPGEIDSIWSTRDFGDVGKTGRIRIDLDGRTVLDAPLQDVVDGKLGAPFAFPLVANSDQSSGGVYIRVPMPFRRSMRVVTEHNPLFHHVTYRAFGDAGGVRTFDPRDKARDVFAALRAAGLRDPKPRAPRRVIGRTAIQVRAGRSGTLLRLPGPGVITALRIRIPDATDEVLAKTRLRIHFDGRRTVDAPLGEFFGAGPSAARVRTLMSRAGPRAGDPLIAWWPMPYARSATVALVNGTAAPIDGEVQVTIGRLTRPPRPALGRFHATSDSGPTVPGRDWTFLRTRGRGKFVGVTHSMSGGGSLPTYLEGDEHVVVDRAPSPQLQGTGTEDFYEGGWYFLLRPFTLPFNGMPSFRTGESGCAASSCLTAYRLMIGDAVSFRSSLDFGIEHGHQNGVDATYGSTAYWYGAP